MFLMGVVKPMRPDLGFLCFPAPVKCQIRGLSHGGCQAHETRLWIFVLCSMSGLQIPIRLV